MSGERSERLVRELARGLAPVRRVPRLRSVAAAVGVVALVVTCAELWAGGTRENLVPLLTGSPGFLTIFLGLALAAAGGVVAALGASVPGREVVERVGLGLLAAAVLLGLAAGPLALLLVAGPEVSPPWARDLDCLLGAARLAVAPALALLWFVARGVPHRPVLAVGLGIAGLVGLGALVMHATCPFAGSRHLVVGHALAPLLAALALALPVGWVLRRRDERTWRSRGA